MRHYRTGRGRSRSNGLGSVINSFKKILNFAPASVAGGVSGALAVAVGTDSLTSGQTGPTDGTVPTGSIIKFITFQHARQNLVNIAAYLHWTVQYTLSGQSSISANVVGGSPQRNQVLKQGMICVGQNQNVNVTVRFKIPPKFQRLREGMTWLFVSEVDQVSNTASQVIYKFYR